MNDLFAPPTEQELKEREREELSQSRYRDKNGKVITARQARHLWNQPGYRKVGRSRKNLGPCTIATTWAPYLNNEDLFETCIFSDSWSDSTVVKRYTTLQEAERGHKLYTRFYYFYFLQMLWNRFKERQYY